MIKLIVADMDGTLVNENKIVDNQTKEAIIKAQEQGVIFAIATGRSYAEINNVDKDLLMDKYGGYIISANGQRLYDYHNNKEYVEAKIPNETVRAIFKLCLDYNMSSYAQIDDKKFYYQPESFKTLKDNRDRGMINFDIDKNFFDDDRAFDKLGFYTEDDKMLELYNRIQNEIAGDFGIYMVNETCLDVVGKGVDKVNQIHKICANNNISNDEVLVLGDGQNDLGMLTHFKYGVAMANSLAIVKDQVNYLTTSNDEAGVARAIERFVFKNYRKPKLIISDMDGTLLNKNREISDANRLALIAAQENQIKVAIASGRSVTNLSNFTDELKLKDYDGYLIGNNGQEEYSFADNNYRKYEVLDIRYMKEIFEIFKGSMKVGIYLFKDTQRYIYINETVDATTVQFRNLEYTELNPVTGMFDVEDYFDKLGIFTNDVDVLKIRDLIQDNIKGDYEIFIISNTAVEIVAKGIDKVNGVKAIVEQEGLCDDEVLVFGDGQNDLKMLSRYPSVIMSNAREELKSSACFEEDNQNFDAVANYVNKILKGN